MKRKAIIFYIGCLALLIAFTCVVFGRTGFVTRKNSVRIGYVESTTSTKWTASYISLKGTMTNTLNIKNGSLDVKITTDSGKIGLEILDFNGNYLYRGKELGTCSFTVAALGKTKIIVTADNHEGSFSFSQSEKSETEDVTTTDIGNKGDKSVAGFVSITMSEAKSIFETPGDYVILDVRRPDEFASGHIPGAINVANETISDTEPSELPDKDQLIYVYCRSGNRSKQAAGKLAAMGYTNIVEFGGIMDWTGEMEY